MSSSIPHVIGTMALLMCSIFVITSFILLGFGIQLDLVKPQLQEVAEYVAATMVDLITLVNQTDAKPILVTKELKIPPSVAERGFTIVLKTVDGDVYVYVYLTFLTTVSAEAPINVRNIHEVKLSTPPVPQELHIEEKLHSGLKHPVVWCFKDSNGVIYIGLGVWSSSSMRSETVSPVVSLIYMTTVDKYMYYLEAVETCTL